MRTFLTFKGLQLFHWHPEGTNLKILIFKAENEALVLNIKVIVIKVRNSNRVKLREN